MSIRLYFHYTKAKNWKNILKSWIKLKKDDQEVTSPEEKIVMKILESN